MARKPNIEESEIDKMTKQFDNYNDGLNALVDARSAKHSMQEVEPQTKLSSREIEKSKDIYLKPHKTIGCRDKFNETYRDDYNYAKEYVQFIAEHKELIGETIDLWTRPFAGMPAEEWLVPTNKPVWGPRYLAEQIKRKYYHRLKSDQSTIISADGMGTYHGAITVDTTIQRLDALPVNNSRKSVFMGALA